MRRLLFVLPALALGTAAPLHAAEGGLLSPNPGLIFWTIIVFGTVLAILSKFAFPAILGAVEARERHLRDLTEAAERDRTEAARLLEEARREMDQAHAKIHEAMAESRAGAERMREEMLTQARREQEELLERARRDIEAERAVALDSVRRDAVELSIRAAEKLVRRNLDAEDNRRLVREYLAEVAGPAAPAGA